MKKILLILAIAATASLRVIAQENGMHPGLRISLLTCTAGNDAASAFGHSAIRVTDSLHHRDIVFNYGTFSFQEPHFLLKFMHGDLNYFLSANTYANFEYSYTVSGRGINEQVLNLTQEQAVSLYSFLIDNLKPENRYYLYDFLADNCATRIRDLFPEPQFTLQDSLTGMTYRDELRRVVGDKRWMMFGIDLLLGMKIDREITLEEAMFLPDRLSENIRLYSNNAKGGEKLAGAPYVLTEPAPGHGKFMDVLLKAVSPVSVFSIIFLVYLLIFLRGKVHRLKFASATSTVLYILLGIGGLLLSYLWFGTNHVWTKWNWNLLWMDPLFLIPAFMHSGKARNITVTVLTVAAVIPLLWFIPMTLNLASIIIILFTVLVACTMQAVYINK